MNQSLNLIQDLDFTEMVNGAESQTVAGGLTIAHRPMPGGDWDDCFPKPLPPVHPPRPIHPPIFEFPKPHPRPFPLPRPIIIGHGLEMTTNH
jgi:hypothetical protein